MKSKPKLNKEIERFRNRFGRFYIKKTPQETIIDIDGNPDCFILPSDDIEQFIADTIQKQRGEIIKKLK